MAAAIAVDRVWKFYGDYAALRDITLNIEPGTCTALLGRNGAGKTTLLRIIAGLSRAAKGQVSICGDDVRTPETRHRLGVLGHAIGIYDELSAMENLRLFARLYDVSDVDCAAMRWLEKVGWIEWLMAWSASSAAVCVSGSRWPGRLFTNPKYSYWTSRSPHSTTEPLPYCRPSCGMR